MFLVLSMYHVSTRVPEVHIPDSQANPLPLAFSGSLVLYTLPLFDKTDMYTKGYFSMIGW